MSRLSPVISGLRGQASESALCIMAGRKLAYSPKPSLKPSNAFSGLWSPATVSHFGPPTAPNNTESAFLHCSNVSSGRHFPTSSIAQPPANTLLK